MEGMQQHSKGMIFSPAPAGCRTKQGCQRGQLSNKTFYKQRKRVILLQSQLITITLLFQPSSNSEENFFSSLFIDNGHTII